MAIAVSVANSAAAVVGYCRGSCELCCYRFWLLPWLLGNSAATVFGYFRGFLRTVMLLLLAIAVALAHVLLSLLAIACPLAYCWRLLTRFAHCAAVVVGDCLRSC